MSPRSSLLLWTPFVVLVAFFSTFYLYLYPVWYGCAFPSSNGSGFEGYRDTIAQHFGSPPDESRTAPFRLLVLADPQLEGDSSLPDPEDAFVRKVGRYWGNLTNSSVSEFPETAWNVSQQLFLEDIPEALWTPRKILDLFGNDYYLAHIFRTLHWWTKPSHVTVLGDLIGSQWVSDGEFELRGWRFWKRVFEGGLRVEDKIMNIHKSEDAINTLLPLDGDEKWKRRIINIAGNHDIGYAGDITYERMERFERVFGKANWDIRFAYTNVSDQQPPTLHLIVLNDMLFDTPALNESLQGETYGYINNLITSRLTPVENRNNSFTLLLTHVPLHKPANVCVDAPFFDFWDHTDGGGVYRPYGLKEQNHLSDHSSQNGILQSIFGMSDDRNGPAGGKGRNGLILTGHDHEGCDVWHYLPQTPDEIPAESSEHEDGHEKKTNWRSTHTSKFNPATANMHTGIREITLRSMMGSYSGNAGLLSLWYDFERGTWDYSMQMCPLGVQHTWWAVHVIDAIAIVLVIAQIGFKVSSLLGLDVRNGTNEGTDAKAKKNQ